MTESEEDSFIHASHKYVILSLFMAHFLYLCKFLYTYPTNFPTITPQQSRHCFTFLYNELPDFALVARSLRPLPFDGAAKRHDWPYIYKVP